LPFKLLTQDLSSDDWSYVVDEELAPELYHQVLSATTSYPCPSSKKLEMRCVESKICGDGLKCSNSLADKMIFSMILSRLMTPSLPT